MTIQKFMTALLLSTSLIYFCAADCTMNKPQIISANGIENSLTGSQDNDNHQAKGHGAPEIKRNAYGVVPMLDNIKEEVIRHYTGMLSQNQTIYQRA